MMEELINNTPYGELQSEVKNIIEQSQRKAYQSVNVILVRRNWYIGKWPKMNCMSLSGRTMGFRLSDYRSMTWQALMVWGAMPATYTSLCNSISCSQTFQTQCV